MDQSNLALEKVLDNSDPGDEILRRFRYQITYAAYLAAFSQEDSSSIKEIFCEFHEDILVRHDDDLLTGVQVKTKDINLPPFTIEDDGIKSACKKFVRLEMDYEGQFKSYSIVSNTGFDRSKPAVCLQTLINKIITGKETEYKDRTKGKGFVKFLMSECNASEAEVYRALKKVRLKTFCALEDIHMKLIIQLRSIETLHHCTESQLDQIADLLVSKAFKASSLHHDSDVCTPYVLGIVDKAELEEQIIEGKKITRSYVETWLADQKQQPVTLMLKDKVSATVLPLGYSRLEIKMDAGGIDNENVELMRAMKFSFENLMIQWLYKSQKKADDQYNQVLLVVQNICREVMDEMNFPNEGTGISLLVKIRQEVKKRYREDPSVFFDCKYEHV